MISRPGYETLRERLDNSGPLSAAELKSGLQSLLPKLAQIHSAGGQVAGNQAQLLSPDIIQIDPQGQWRLLISAFDSDISDAPIPQSKLAYLSPEQRDRGELAPAGDIYAIGVIIFEALVGALPEGLEGLRERDPSLPLWAERCFKSCYAPLSRRPKNAEALLEALNDALNGPRALEGMIYGTAIDTQLELDRLDLSLDSAPVKLAPSMREPDFTVAEGRAAQPSTRSRVALLLSFLVAALTSTSLLWFQQQDRHLGHGPDPFGFLLEAEQSYKAGSYQRAYSLCQRFFEVLPNGPAEAFHLRALILSELGELNEALVDFNRALVADPARAKCYRDRADLLVYLRDPGNAIADYQRFLELCPDSTDAALLRGRCAELASREPL